MQQFQATQYAALRGALNTLEESARNSISEAELSRALAAVERFALSQPAGTPLLGSFHIAIPPVLALACGAGGGRNKAAAAEAALKVLRNLLQANDRVGDAVLTTIGADSVIALVRGGGGSGGGAGRTAGLELFRLAAALFPRHRNAMLAAGVGPALIEVVSQRRWGFCCGGAADATDVGQAQQLLEDMQKHLRTHPTVDEVRAALPGLLLMCARRPTGAAYALRLVHTLIPDGKVEYVQAALDEGVPRVVTDALRSCRDQCVVEAACGVVRALASGSAAQLAVLLESGLVPALCGSAAPSPPGAPHATLDAMRCVVHVGTVTVAERNARLLLFRNSLVPQLLDILSGKEKTRKPSTYGAAAWLSAVSALGPEMCALLRECGAIPVLADFFASVWRASSSTARVVRATVERLCREGPPAPIAVARAALPSLVRLCSCADSERRAAALRCVEGLLLLRRQTGGNDAAAALLRHAGSREHVQAALDAGAAFLVVDALHSEVDGVLEAACDVLSVLASGNAAQQAVVLDAGVVAAVCSSARLLECAFPLAQSTMTRVAALGMGTDAQRNARKAVVRNSLVPQLLAILSGEEKTRKPPTYGAAAWLSAVSALGPEMCTLLRECGAIPVLADFFASVWRASSRTARVVRATLERLCREGPPAPIAVARAALPSLVRLCSCADSERRAAALRCVEGLILLRQRPTGGDDAAAALLRHAGSREHVQAALDAGLLPPLVASLDRGGLDETELAARVVACVAAGSTAHLQVLLDDAGALPRLCLAAGKMKSAASNAAEAAARLVSEAAPTGGEGEAEDNDGRAALLRGRALPQLLDALAGGQTPPPWPVRFICRAPALRCVGAARALRVLSTAPAACVAAVFNPQVVAALDSVAKCDDHCEWAARTAAAQALLGVHARRLGVRVSVPQHLVPAALFLCRHGTAAVAHAALTTLQSMEAEAPEAVKEGLRGLREPLYRPPQTSYVSVAIEASLTILISTIILRYAKPPLRLTSTN